MIAIETAHLYFRQDTRIYKSYSGSLVERIKVIIGKSTRRVIHKEFNYVNYWKKWLTTIGKYKENNYFDSWKKTEENFDYVSIAKCSVEKRTR